MLVAPSCQLSGEVVFGLSPYSSRLLFSRMVVTDVEGTTSLDFYCSRLQKSSKNTKYRQVIHSVVVLYAIKITSTPAAN